MTASNHSEPGVRPQTRCANCETVFEVPAELLESNDTRVRCGECLSIFDALEGLEQAPTEIPAADSGYTGSAAAGPSAVASSALVESAGSLEDFSNLDVTYSDFDLFSDDAELPEVRYFEETRDRADFNFDSVEIEQDQTFSETLFVNDVTINADLPLSATAVAGSQPAAGDVAAWGGSTDPAASGQQRTADTVTGEEQAAGQAQFNALANQARVEFAGSSAADRSAPLIFEYHDPDDTLPPELTEADAGDTVREPVAPPPLMPTPSRRRKWLQGIAGSLVLVLLLGSLYLYRERHELYNDPAVRPVYVAFCALTGCTVPLPFDPEQMGLLRRSIYPHPRIAEALVINVVIKNKAAFAQRYPVLAIRLEENSGAALATRDFLPTDYLEPGQWHEQATIEAGAAISITLEIKDPGKNAASFTLKFR